MQLKIYQLECVLGDLQALQSIAAFKSLQQLVLADCSAITTGGLQQLSALTGLCHLALVRCPRVGDRGMTLLHALTCLSYLALNGCTKVSSQPVVLSHCSICPSIQASIHASIQLCWALLTAPGPGYRRIAAVNWSVYSLVWLKQVYTVRPRL